MPVSAITCPCRRYGSLVCRVAQRTKEIGNRIAPGAKGTRVVALVVKSAARTAICGAIVLLTAAAQFAACLPARLAAPDARRNE